ncbi:MAG: polymer-forming cytoskeletal protein [Alphaproteobacteria bacterium]|nr:MAG: polymer-forming cytoskeletal protein [Alphaproteobacteria bacterium]
MFANGTAHENETVIAEGLKIEGKVSADGLVKVHGKIIGDLDCNSLIISDKAEINGTVSAETIIVDGIVEGPIRGNDVELKAHAQVTGDIHHSSLSIEKGARFEGRSKQVDSPLSAGSKGRKGAASKAATQAGEAAAA